ncbi:MAG: hypothetical protein EOP56_12625 [Sphingobacteriales bacterium]|nr:MAG: hypothetical protein EOP56_12625 [Sphingobacteriales bacterium]
MNRLAIAAVASVFLFSCKAEPQKALTPAEIKAKTDSIVAVRAVDVRSQADEDLDRRMSIEVKVKADSLMQKCMEGTPVVADPNQTVTPAPPALSAEP